MNRQNRRQYLHLIQSKSIIEPTLKGKESIVKTQIYYMLSSILIMFYCALTNDMVREQHLFPNTVLNALCFVYLSYWLIVFCLHRISQYQFTSPIHYLVPSTLVIYSLGLGIIVLFRLEYARSPLVHGFYATIAAIFICELIKLKQFRRFFFVMPNVNVEFSDQGNLSFQKLSPPFYTSHIKGGIIVDLHSKLSPNEEAFITDCCVQGIPVFDSGSLQDQLDGKLHVITLTENSIGQLNPPNLYLSIKRLWESCLILLLSPIITAIFLIISLIIVFENQGSIFYKQQRIGQKGKAFYIYKFRTMIDEVEKNTEQRFATQEENRITAIGKLLRQSRLDELPQVWNVLKGDMSLIGPRPEQPEFVEEFKLSIPFYHYRHIVKPGITGWAQVIQGYTDSTDTTKHKLAYDFYYIKHLSFWLDMNIILKTIKTILTGNGAK